MMTLRLMDEHRAWSSEWLGPLVLSAPLLLGAGHLEQSTHEPVLPPKEIYRTPSSETIPGNSADWRQSSSQRELDWRKPKDSESNWRTNSPQTMQGPQHHGHVQVLPQYEMGTTFDFTKEKATDQIKSLGFTFKTGL